MDRQHKKERSDMKTLHADLKSGDQVFRYGNRDYTIHQVKMDLANRLARCQTRDGTLKQMHQVYEARLRGLNSSRQQLEQMLATRRQLEVDLENIDAHRKMVEVAKTASHLSLDDSRLSRIKDLLADLNTRLEVDSKLADADNHFQEEIPVSSPQAGNIEDQVAAYFQEETTSDQAYVVSD